MSGTGLAVAILSAALARALTSAGQAGRRPVARCSASKARGAAWINLSHFERNLKAPIYHFERAGAEPVPDLIFAPRVAVPLGVVCRLARWLLITEPLPRCA